METIIITLTKKARKYFHGTINGHAAKLNIDENSESHYLPLNTPLRLIINNLSVQSDYGMTLNYAIHPDMHEIIESGISPISFKPDFYNTRLTKQCRKISGVFNYETQEWQFWPYFKEEAEELINCWMSVRVVLPVSFNESQTILDDRITYCGETICFFTNTYKEILLLGDNAELISGKISVQVHRRKVHISIQAGTVINIKVPIYTLNYEQKKSVKSGIPQPFTSDS